MRPMSTTTDSDLMEKIVSLSKRRGFIFQSSEIYGGLANSWDYGPLGVELKNNIRQAWWNFFVKFRGDVVGIDGSIITHPKVWGASGHVESFEDIMLICSKCKEKIRADHFIQEKLKINVEGQSVEKINSIIKKNKLNYTIGTRFYHLMSSLDKGKAVKILTNIFKL